MSASMLDNHEPRVEVRDIHKAYLVDGRRVQALAGVSLQAAKGEFVTIIGPSGCGKSTLFSVICGLQQPDQGQVCFDGMPAVERAGLVGYMPQRDLLMPWRRVLDNAILGPEVQGEDLQAARLEAEELLPMFGLEGFGDSFPTELSGGMRQRAALLRTFLCRKDLMLLDEPFGALDAITRKHLQRWLLQVWQRFHHTILFVTHDVEEAVFLSDRVFVLTPRPACVSFDLRIGLPRPRSPELLLAPEFLALKQSLLTELGEA
jgi:ABC-type nitrate/sulfonate/bicarbonate transport system ATPase subunit